MYSYYQNADVFIFPSYNEGVPNALIEAMAAGCHIICYDIPGVSGIIRHGINGRLVQPGDMGGLTEELKWYLENKDSPEIQNYSKYNQAFLDQYYDSRKIIGSYLDMYSNLAMKNNVHSTH
jgi:glycosyltransferase involved in cell wall biosynthesis